MPVSVGRLGEYNYMVIKGLQTDTRSYAINLARDFGPRLMSYILGYGHEVWSAGGYYFWVRSLPLIRLCRRRLVN